MEKTYIKWNSIEILSLLVNTQRAIVTAQLNATDNEYYLNVEWDLTHVAIRLWRFVDKKQECLINHAYEIDYDFNGGCFVDMVANGLNDFKNNKLPLTLTIDDMLTYFPPIFSGIKRLY